MSVDNLSTLEKITSPIGRKWNVFRWRLLFLKHRFAAAVKALTTKPDAYEFAETALRMGCQKCGGEVQNHPPETGKNPVSYWITNCRRCGSQYRTPYRLAYSDLGGKKDLRLK